MTTIEYHKQYYKNNREKLKAKSINRYINNKEQILLYFKNRRDINKNTIEWKTYFESYRKEKRQYLRDCQNERKRLARLHLLSVMGGCCRTCGFSDLRGLQLDHIKDNGKTDIKFRISRYSAKDYNEMAENPQLRTHLQLLCATCNWIKRYNFKKEFKVKRLQEVRKNLIETMGNQCNHCGYNKDYRAIHLDHINGGGNRDRKENDCLTIFQYLKMNREAELRKNFQLLCVTCNWIKRYTNDETTRRGNIND